MLPFAPTLGAGSRVEVQGWVSHDAHCLAVGLTSSPFQTTSGLERSPGSVLAAAPVAAPAVVVPVAAFAAFGAFGSAQFGGGARQPRRRVGPEIRKSARICCAFMPRGIRHERLGINWRSQGGGFLGPRASA